MARLVKGLKLKHEDLVRRPSTHVQSQMQEQMSVTSLSLEDLIPSITAHLCEAVPFPLRTHSKSHYEMPCVTAVMLCVLEQQRGPRPTAGVRVTPGSTAPRLENGKPLSIFSSYNVSVTKCFRRVQTQDRGRNTLVISAFTLGRNSLVISAFTLETEREFLQAPPETGERIHPSPLCPIFLCLCVSMCMRWGREGV